MPGNHTRPPGASGFTGSERGQHLVYSDGHGYPGTWKIGAQSSTSDGVLNEDETAPCRPPDHPPEPLHALTGPATLQGDRSLDRPMLADRPEAEEHRARRGEHDREAVLTTDT